MQIFETLGQRQHEQVVFFSLPDVGLKAIVAIHDTTLGPALGGCRMYPYASDAEALDDVLRLSEAMTYKAAAAGLHLGGGKSVIIGDPKRHKSELLFRGFGKAVDSLGGRYITAEDMGTDVHDMELIFAETDYVSGVDTTLQGILASAERAFGERSVRGRSVAVQGLGHVGSNLSRLLKEEGARVIACDVDAERAERVASELSLDEIVAPRDIYEIPCDVFAPCAMG